MRGLGFAVAVALVLGAGAAQAACTDDLQALQTRIERAQRQHPTPQSAAAGKVLQKLAENNAADEVDCYNAVSRARRALNAPPPEEEQQAQRPPAGDAPRR